VLLANARRHDEAVATRVRNYAELLTWSANIDIDGEVRTMICKVCASSIASNTTWHGRISRLSGIEKRGLQKRGCLAQWQRQHQKRKPRDLAQRLSVPKANIGQESDHECLVGGVFLTKLV
jgi:hypothetical protein